MATGFSKLDLVCCRNVLIYFTPALQKRVLATFHYCLNDPGFLLLGRTESTSGSSQLFSAVDKAHNLLAIRPGAACSTSRGVECAGMSRARLMLRRGAPCEPC